MIPEVRAPLRGIRWHHRWRGLTGAALSALISRPTKDGCCPVRPVALAHGGYRRVGAYQLAQLDVARAVAPFEDPRMADFMSRLEEVNALAERSPGFVWRLQARAGTRPISRSATTPW
jgi:hypothetical protein